MVNITPFLTKFQFQKLLLLQKLLLFRNSWQYIHLNEDFLVYHKLVMSEMDSHKAMLILNMPLHIQYLLNYIQRNICFCRFFHLLHKLVRQHCNFRKVHITIEILRKVEKESKLLSKLNSYIK